MLLRLPKLLPPHLPTEMRLALPLPMAHLARKMGAKVTKEKITVTTDS
jgi:hypothetical protein